MKAQGTQRWFWVWVIQMTVAKANLNNPNALCEVWKNLVIVGAIDVREAYRKAKAIGKSEAGDCRGTLRLNGEPALTKFLGIADMGLIHDELGNGCEVLWELRKCRQRNAKSLVRSRSTLLKAVRGELRSCT